MNAKSTFLFDPIAIGHLKLPNRIVMASMTRGRATNSGLVPTALHAEYYAQRASAGLILAEGTWPSAGAIGYVNVPGLYTEDQVEGWRGVTQAVHAAGGRIFAQLGHVGATSHPDLRDGAVPSGPSAVNTQQNIFTPEGFKESPTPRAMTLEEIHQTIAEYRSAAVNAQRAGFDGIELHAHHTYLIPQFLSDRFNLRDDAYGGSIEKRARFLFEVLEALIDVWGSERVGIKLNPSLSNFGGFLATEQTTATHEYVVERLNDYPLAYLQLAKMAIDVKGTPVEFLGEGLNTFRHFRPLYRGRIIANGGFTRETGESIVAEGLAEMVAYALPFIANPDLVERFVDGSPLDTPDPDTLYAGDAKGYVDYPRAGRLLHSA